MSAHGEDAAKKFIAFVVNLHLGEPQPGDPCWPKNRWRITNDLRAAALFAQYAQESTAADVLGAAADVVEKAGPDVPPVLVSP